MGQSLLEHITDRQEIIDLTIKYTCIIDRGPREQLREIFTDSVFVFDASRYFFKLPHPIKIPVEFRSEQYR